MLGRVGKRLKIHATHGQCDDMPTVTFPAVAQLLMRATAMRQVRDPARQTLHVSQVVVHPSYSPRGQDSDVALLRLSGQLKLNANVQPVCLPRWSVPPNIMCVVTGWGQTKSKQHITQTTSPAPSA